MATDAATPSRAATSAPSKSARPRELNLDGKKPCDLLPQQDWPKFLIEKQGKLKADETDVGGITCFYSNDVGYFQILVQPNKGIEYWTKANTSEKIEYTDPVAGFPAVERAESRDKQRCDIIVDVADNQFLLATTAIDPGNESRMPPKCDLAHQLAEVAVTSLLNGS